MTWTRLACLSALCTLPLLACDGGESTEDGGTETGAEADGDGDGDNGDGDGDPEGSGACGEETITVIQDLSAVPASFDESVDAMIAAVVGSYSGTYEWYENDGPTMVTHAGTSSDLSMAVAYQDGEVRLIEVELHGMFPDEQLGGFLCSNRIEVDAQLDFATADGLFQESDAITLSAESVYGKELGFRRDLDFSAHQGSLQLSDFSFTDALVLRLELGGGFAGAGVTGGLGMEVEIPDLEVIGFGGVARYEALLDGANSLCGACNADEYCQILTTPVASDGGSQAYSCEPIPQACADAPSCDCIEAETCGALSAGCTEGEVITLECITG